MTIQAVLFDLDGTLIDTAPDFIRLIHQMCAKEGITPPSASAIREQVSAGARAMVRLMLSEPDIKDDDPKLIWAREQFLQAYKADICVDSQLFEGLDALLATLESQGVVWGIVTNKPRHLAQALLAKLKLDTRCAVLVCPEDVKHTKPDPEPLLLACQSIATDPAKTLYIGDHVRDIVAGKAANMPTIVAEYGYLSQEDKHNMTSWGADYYVKTPKALTELIKSLI